MSASGDRWLRSYEYDFDKNNNVTSFAVGNKSGSIVTRYTYGDDNLLTKTTLHNGKEVTYTYGYLGKAYGYAPTILYAGSYYAAGFPTEGDALRNEIFSDWYYITLGYYGVKNQ